MHQRDKISVESAVRSGTQSIQRAAALLRELMVSNREGAPTSELAARAGIERTTAHRMLRCLVDEGLVSHDAGTKRFYLGPLAYELGLAAAERTDLRAICKPALARIADETQDTVFLMIRSGDDAVCVERAEGSYPVKTFVVDVGTRRPLGVGAGSLAILSALPVPEAELVLARNAGRLASYEELTADRLRQMMLHASTGGHVAMDVVNVHGVRAVAVPITTAAGRAVAALSIAAVQWRMTTAREQVLIARLRQEATQLGELLSRSA